MKGIRKYLVAALSLMGLALPLQGTNILFTITGTLALANGTDNQELDGATFEYSAVFDDQSLYTDIGASNPITKAVSGSSKVTITPPIGSSSLVSGEYFTTEPVTFGPRLTGSLTYFLQIGDTIGVDLSGVGLGSFGFNFQWVASAAALSTVVGGTPLIADFSPGATATFLTAPTIDGAGYTLSGGVISASAIPEGKYFGLAIGLMSLAFIGFRKRKSPA